MLACQTARPIPKTNLRECSRRWEQTVRVSWNKAVGFTTFCIARKAPQLSRSNSFKPGRLGILSAVDIRRDDLCRHIDVLRQAKLLGISTAPMASEVTGFSGQTWRNMGSFPKIWMFTWCLHMFTIVYPCVPENMECRCCLPFVWVKDLLTNKDRETGGPKKGFAKAKSKVVQGTCPLSRRFPRIHRCEGSFTKMHICM